MNENNIKYEIIDKKNVDYKLLEVEVEKLFFDDDSNISNVDEFIKHLKLIFRKKI